MERNINRICMEPGGGSHSGEGMPEGSPDLYEDDKEAGILETSAGHDYSEEKIVAVKKYFSHKLTNKEYLKIKMKLIGKYLPISLKEPGKFRRGLDLFHSPRGTVMVVSDAHINQIWREGAPSLIAFLEHVKSSRRDVSDIVMLGDMFDFQRGLDARDGDTWTLWWEIVRMHEIGRIRLHYIYGNHDYSLSPASIGKIKLPASRFFPFTARDRLPLKSEGRRFLFIHGHELETWPMWFYEPTSRAGGHFGLYGALLEGAWYGLEALSKKVSKSKKSVSERTMDISHYEKYANELREREGYNMLIHGHTELPYKKQSVSCPGSWNIRTDGVRTFMEIKNGNIEIRQFFNKDDIKTIISNKDLREPKKPDPDFIRDAVDKDRGKWGGFGRRLADEHKIARDDWGKGENSREFMKKLREETGLKDFEDEKSLEEGKKGLEELAKGVKEESGKEGEKGKKGLEELAKGVKEEGEGEDAGKKGLETLRDKVRGMERKKVKIVIKKKRK